MIKIEIPEVYYSEDPNQAAIQRSQMEIFCEGFKKLCIATDMYNIDITRFNSILIPTQLHFDDGSLIGIKKLFQEIGFNIKDE